MAVNDEDKNRSIESAYFVRDRTVEFITEGPVLEGVERLLNGCPALILGEPFPELVRQLVANDLRQECGWKLENWILNAKGGVDAVTDNEFLAEKPEQRFSRNQCLRQPNPYSFALRGFIAALRSPQVEAMFSKIFNGPIKLKSADIARYRKGEYLRRHADTFEDRQFGLVWFLEDNWKQGAGGELIVEGAGGEASVFPPIGGNVAALRIRPAFQHQVAQVAAADWVRYSVAAHYHLSSE